MREACGNDRGTAAHSPQGGGGLKAKFPGLGGDEIGDLMTLQMRPHGFGRIEFRRAGWQSLRDDFIPRRGKAASGQLAAVHGGSVPNDQDAPFGVALQVPEELHDLRPFCIGK